MKKTISLFSLLIIILYYPIHGQDANNQNTTYQLHFNPQTSSYDARPLVNEIDRKIPEYADSFNCNCTTDFWSVKADGEIQLWHLINGSISEGPVVLSGGPYNIAFCGPPDSTTFYSGNGPDPGISYYNLLDDWTQIDMPTTLYNNGGYLDNQYYQGVGYGNPYCRVLYTLIGEEIIMIDSLSDKTYTVADIAVDSLGQAWTFVGPGATSSIYVYDYSGLITTYDLSFNAYNAYGLAFINDTLYIAFGLENNVYHGAIVPVLIDNNTASLGDPIPFPYALTDLATCNCIETTTGISDEQIRGSQIKVFPNPASGMINISNLDGPASYQIMDMSGHLVKEGVVDSDRINIKELSEGLFFLELKGERTSVIRKFIKQ